MTLLDPAAATAAPHGQIASALPEGGLAVSCHKLVEDGARTQILRVPGLFRLDVRPVEDTLQVSTRSLHSAPTRWSTAEAPFTDYGKAARAGGRRLLVRRRGRAASARRPDLAGFHDRPGKRCHALRGARSRPRSHLRVTILTAVDREDIERHDFPVGRRGYDPAAVDEHLRRVADEIDALRANPGSRPAPTPLSAGTSEQVRAILEAAETGAAELRAEAGREAGQHVARVEEAAGGMLAKLDELESQLTTLLEALRRSGEQLNDGLARLQEQVSDFAGEEAEPEPAGEPEPASPSPSRLPRPSRPRATATRRAPA